MYAPVVQRLHDEVVRHLEQPEVVAMAVKPD